MMGNVLVSGFPIARREWLHARPLRTCLTCASSPTHWIACGLVVRTLLESLHLPCALTLTLNHTIAPTLSRRPPPRSLHPRLVDLGVLAVSHEL